MDGFPYQSFIACVGGEEGVLSDLNLVGGALATIEQTLSLERFRIFVLSNTGTGGVTRNKSDNGSITDDVDLDGLTEVNVTECRLRDASYSVSFEFRYPNQTIESTVTE
jgi:hypothetical protein